MRSVLHRRSVVRHLPALSSLLLKGEVVLEFVSTLRLEGLKGEDNRTAAEHDESGREYC